ncbi:MAG TPA: iron ABC transporter substrate-binding protein [Actinomycetota bacterium]|nr:iron ABC transporter substrate-binding protein [Actinomycetota bacterium]
MLRLTAALALVLAAAPACGGDDGELTVYTGREESLVAPLFDSFEEETGIEVQVRYGDTAEMASTILEEGDGTPADVFFAQDAGALGALEDAGMVRELPGEILEEVPSRFRSRDGAWVGISGRARVVAYSTERVDPAELPDSILGFTDPRWSRRIGWAPTNGSFQAFVTALRLVEGEEATRDWLEGVLANDPVVYESNTPALEGIAAGEVDVAFVNHYYLFVKRDEEGPDYPVENAFLGGGDAGALVNVAGAAILDSSDAVGAAERFVEFLLSEEAQSYFAEETHEYPLVDGVPAEPGLTPLEDLDPPDIDLGALEDLQGTLRLLQEVGVLP